MTGVAATASGGCNHCGGRTIVVITPGKAAEFRTKHLDGCPIKRPDCCVQSGQDKCRQHLDAERARGLSGMRWARRT